MRLPSGRPFLFACVAEPITSLIRDAAVAVPYEGKTLKVQEEALQKSYAFGSGTLSLPIRSLKSMIPVSVMMEQRGVRMLRTGKPKC